MPQTGTYSHRQVGLGGMVLPVAPGSCGLSGLVKYRRTWERMGSGGLRGPQNRCEACKTSWMCSIHIRSPPYATSAFVLAVLLRAAKALFCFVTGPSRRLVFGERCLASCSGFEYADGGVLPYDYRKTADLSCVVQAGGLSSRMGCDKARMTFCGKPLIERVLERLALVGGELVVTTSRRTSLPTLRSASLGACCRA